MFVATTSRAPHLPMVGPALIAGNATDCKSAVASDKPSSWSGSDCNLTGEYAGDYGWGTVGFAIDPITFACYHEAELIHARWAMLGTLGCVTPELLTKYPVVHCSEPSDGGLDYLSNSSLVHAQSWLATRFYQVVLIAAVANRHEDGVPWMVQIDDFCDDGSCNLPDRFDDLVDHDIWVKDLDDFAPG